MEVDVENPAVDHVQKPTQIIAVRLNKAPKTSVERGREFRARKAQLKQQSKQQQEPDAIDEIATEDIRIAEKRARSAEASRRWREKKKALRKKTDEKKQAKTAAQRMREYLERKKLAKKTLLKQPSDQDLDALVSTSSSQVNQRAGPSTITTINSISAELTRRGNSQSPREYRERRNDNITIGPFNRTLKRQTVQTCVEGAAKSQNAIAGISRDVSENDIIAAQSDQMTQVDFLEEPNDLKLFICNRFDYGIICHAEVQTAIPLVEGDVFEKKKVIKKKTPGIYPVPVYQAVSLIQSTSRFHENSSVKGHRKIIDATSSVSSNIENDKMEEDSCRTVKSEETEFVVPDINYKGIIASNPCERIKSEPIDAVINCEETDINFEDTKIGLAEKIVNFDEIKIENVNSNNTDVNEHVNLNSPFVNVVVKCEPFIKQEIDDAAFLT